MILVDNIKKWAATSRIAAVEENGRSISFAQLNEQSDALAVMLAQYPRGTSVCLWGDKENEMLVFILAAIKSGHPYVVLSSYFPPQRVRQITTLAQPSVVLCATNGVPEIPGAQVLLPDQIMAAVMQYAGQSADECLVLTRDENLTFFFTSGSTGVPKCVPATVAVAENVALAYNKEIDCYFEADLAAGRQLINLNIASYAFCSSIPCIMDCGRYGSVLYAVSHEQSSEYETLYNYIKKVNPHTFDCSPQFLSMCLTDPEFNETTLTNLRMLSVGGENLSRRIGLEYMEQFPNVPLCNGYGATEMCAGPMWCRVTRDMLEKYDIMPIGVPVEGASCYIEDDDGHIVTDDGAIGELVVKGSFITSGYYNDPERTAKVFVKNQDGEVCYHTNDLVSRYNGQYFYVGRKDNLVKVGGYRVEIEEVEEYLSRVPGIKACAVVPATKEGRAVMLAAYIVLNKQPVSVIKEIQSIRHVLLEKLQPYMVPQKIKFVDALPQNANGKVDRARLKAQSVIG